MADDFQVTPTMILSLADEVLKLRGGIAALRHTASILANEIKDFSALIKSRQEDGHTSIEMTPELIKAYNNVLWSTGLILGVLGKTDDKGNIVPFDESVMPHTMN